MHSLAFRSRGTLSAVRPTTRWPANRRSLSRCHAGVSVPSSPLKEADTAGDKTEAWKLVCPICLDSLLTEEHAGASSGLLECGRCQRNFGSAQSRGYMDLTVGAGMQKTAYNEKSWAGAELFKQPFVSGIYERGWRQGFSWSGSPGADKEFNIMLNYLQDYFGGNIVDVSCGSGLFTRRFLSCGKFSNVLATDYSDSMMRQTLEYVQANVMLDTARLSLVKADIHRLPFQTDSLPAIHAGAAIHCWQTPSIAMSEISRVLQPGGMFVGSTFLDVTAPLGRLLGNDEVLQPLRSLDFTQPSAFRWWSEPELRDLFASVGLQNFQCTRFPRFIIWKVQKPNSM
eukprot:jgi/Ulvmu1/4421/UM002_0146.1